MTPGITGYSLYLPRHRLPREAISTAWGSARSPGCKAVCHYDEDSLTMAQSAAWQLLQAGSRPQALYFASTTAPYWQRSPARLRQFVAQRHDGTARPAGPDKRYGVCRE